MKTKDAIVKLQASLDDQAQLIVKMAAGMRSAFAEGQQEVPDIDMMCAKLAESYPGGSLAMFRDIRAPS